jgi:hypothetical protein
MNPVSKLVAVTVAPGMAAALGSVTAPRIVPLVNCAFAGSASSPIKRTPKAGANILRRCVARLFGQISFQTLQIRVLKLFMVFMVFYSFKFVD